uniref:Chromo domain-containing protein n=1 Tax=Periophthalmus magnuspinnatus TaxID=409849 RepID=A0A3B4B298_9GOBI
MELSAAGDRIFAAEAILKRRVRKGRLEYLVKWKGWCSEDQAEDVTLSAGLVPAKGSEQGSEGPPKGASRWHPQLAPSCKDVVVTDVTTNLVTVTIKEFPSPSDSPDSRCK